MATTTVLALASPLLAIIPASAAPAPAPAAAACQPVSILAFRGSDGHNLASDVTNSAGREFHYPGSTVVTNGWEGDMLYRLFQQYILNVRDRFSDGFKEDTVPIYGVGPSDDSSPGYPAIPAWHEVFNDLLASAESGKTAAMNLTEKIRNDERAKGCEDPKFIAVGYSQGAVVARTLAQLQPAIVGVVDMGDPIQKPFSPGNSGTGNGGNGLIRWKHKDLQSTFDQFYGLDTYKSALCHHGDPMCDYNWFIVGAASTIKPTHHESYYKEAAEAGAAGAELADLVHRTYVESAKAPVPRAGMDTVFAIDTTGSMGSQIQSVRDAVDSIAQRNLTAATNSRVGLVEYKDHSDGYVSRQVVPLTGDIAAFQSGLDSLSAYGGGDYPEAVYSGLMEALSMNWNPDATRSVVAIGDAPAHDPEPVTGYTAGQLQKYFANRLSIPTMPLAMDLGADRSPLMKTASYSPAGVAAKAGAADMPVTLYSLSSSPELTSQLQPIVDATGGLSMDVSTPGALGDRIIKAMDDATTAPEAHVAVSSLAVAGLKASVSAAGSTGGSGALSYAFDLDGDGVFETQSAGPAVMHVFATPGSHTVSVKVTDERGRATTDSAVVQVKGTEVLAPTPTLDPADASTVLAGVELSSKAVPQGGTTQVFVPGLRSDEQYGLKLVPSGSTDPWTSEPVVTVGPFAATADGGRTAVTIPATLTPGDFSVLVLTDQGRHAMEAVSVTSAGSVPGPQAPGPIPPAPTQAPTVPTAPTVLAAVVKAMSTPAPRDRNAEAKAAPAGASDSSSTDHPASEVAASPSPSASATSGQDAAASPEAAGPAVNSDAPAHEPVSNVAVTAAILAGGVLAVLALLSVLHARRKRIATATKDDL